MSTQAAPVAGIAINRIDGTPTTLGAYAGKVLLVVNVASKCGLTPQYEGLEKLYQEFHGRGLEVLGFPANEFGAQEPGTNAEIQEFCSLTYGVKFPMFEKIVVKGEGIHPLYQAMKAAQPKADDLGDPTFAENLAKYGVKQENPDDVAWNFEKFLIDRQGKVRARFAPSVSPQDPTLIAAINDLLSLPA